MSPVVLYRNCVYCRCVREWLGLVVVLYRNHVYCRYVREWLGLLVVLYHNHVYCRYVREWLGLLVVLYRNHVYCRYVREWLGLMVVSRIVDVDRESKKYFLPRHRRATLRTAPPGGLQGLFSWTVPMNGAVVNTVTECFKKDGPRGNS